MNDTNYMDNNGNDVDIDVLVEQQTPVGGVSATNRLPVVDTLLVYKIIFIVMGVIFLIALCFGDIKANATENSVYVDSAYMQEQFGNYPYYLIVTDGSGNYMALYSSAQICYNGTVFRAFCTNHYYGYKTLKVVDDYLVIDENGTSYDKWSSISVSFNSNGLPSTYKTIVYASKDIYNTGTSNTGSPIVGTTVYYSAANNIGSKPVEDITPGDGSGADDGADDGASTAPGAPAVDAAAIYTPICYKLDLIIFLLISFFAAYMFKGLANPYKMGGKHIGKSS